MRVYEYAKQVGITAKELLSKLSESGFEIASHMSVLDQNMLSFLDNSSTPDIESAPEQPTSSSHLNQKPETDLTGSVDNAPFHEKNIAPLEVPLKSMSVINFSAITGISIGDVILTLLRSGTVAAKNQIISESIVASLARHYGFNVVRQTMPEQEPLSRLQSANKHAILQERLAVVVVLGHVDHGKTTLLDYIRKTRIASKEKGGITQHLGAYEAKTNHGNIVFLDTPGHEAFSRIRQRGIRVADIVVLVVAADDGIMQQTVESINQAKAMAVPIIVAINKIDKVDAQRLEGIKRELSRYDLLPEEWGGTTICVPISAKTGEGIDLLLEMIALQSEVMELRADIAGPAKGYVLEAKVERGRGPVATLISQHGLLNIGDFFVSGSVSGKISSMIDYSGKSIKHALPSVPVQIGGIDGLPVAGEYFEIVSRDELRLKQKAIHDRRASGINRVFTEGALNLIIKTDNNSSKEALLESLEKLAKKTPVGFNILHAAVGNINESDIELSFNTGADLIGLHVKSESNATILAQVRGVSIRLFDIIYKLLEDLEARAEGKREIEYITTKVGEASVIRVFDVKNIGVIAGANVREGKFSRDGSVVVWRGSQKVGEGKISSLQREKRSVKEVHAGFECGFMVQDFNDWKLNDRVECFVETPKNNVLAKK